jgi:hypothetical protein
MNSIRFATAVALNNQGTRLCYESNAAAVASSLPFFQQALALLQNLTDGDVPSNEAIDANASLSNSSQEHAEKNIINGSSSRSDYVNDCPHTDTLVPQHAEFVAGTAVALDSEHSGLSNLHHYDRNNGDFFVFQRPFRLSPSTVPSAATHNELVSVLFESTTVVLFNMALVWHAVGIHQASLGNTLASSAFWAKAGEVYDVLLRFVLDNSHLQPMSCNGESHREWNTIPTIVVNNRAALYYEQGEYRQYLECLCCNEVLLQPFLRQAVLAGNDESSDNQLLQAAIRNHNRNRTTTPRHLFYLYPAETLELFANVLLHSQLPVPASTAASA